MKKKILKRDLEENIYEVIFHNNHYVLSKMKYTSIAANNTEKLKISLDDVAQIFGSNCLVSSYEDLDINLNHIDEVGGLLINDKKGFALLKGRNLEEAINAAHLLEKQSYVNLMSKKLGLEFFHDADLAENIKYKYLNGYMKNVDNLNIKCNDEEKNLPYYDERKQIISYGLKMLKDKLVKGTWGNISMKVKEDLMLVTPSAIPYTNMKPSDIILLRISDYKILDEYRGINPTSEKNLHASIYRNKKDINAIIHTHSNNISVFAATRSEFENIRVTDYKPSGSIDIAEEVVEKMGDNKFVIMANHGFVACDINLNDAYKNALSIEKKAEKILFS